MIGRGVKKQFREKLLEKRDRARRDAERGMRMLLSGEGRQLIGAGLEEGDLAVYYQTENMSCRNFENLRLMIHGIDRALERLDDGTYGMCEDCNNEIGSERLRILPFAIYCTECQESREKQKVNGAVCTRTTKK